MHWSLSKKLNFAEKSVYNLFVNRTGNDVNNDVLFHTSKREFHHHRHFHSKFNIPIYNAPSANVTSLNAKETLRMFAVLLLHMLQRNYPKK